MRKSKLYLDRLEEDRAVLLAKSWGEEIIFPAFLIPSKAREGDILDFSIEISRPETEKAKAIARDLLKKLEKKDLT